MRKPKGQYIALLLIALMVLAACTGGPAATTEQPTEASSQQTKAPETPQETETAQEPAEGARDLYTIQVFSSNAVKLAKWSDTPVGKVMLEKFNIDIELVPPPAGDNKEQMGLMLSAGNYPEVVGLQDQDITSKYIAANALVALDPYLDNMPNFTEWFKESIPYWRQAAGDGKLYNWNTLLPQDQAVFPENNDMVVRTDLLEQQGWKVPVTTDEWLAFLKTAKEQNPTTPDGEPTIGIVAPLGESWGMAGIVPILYEKGEGIQINNNATFYLAEQDKFIDTFTHPDTKESFQFFNKLYREGLMDEETFTDKMDQVQAKVDSGRALSVWYVTWVSGGANKALKEKGWDSMMYITAPVQSTGQVARGEKNIIMTQLTRPFDTIAITKNAKFPERILEVVDFSCTEEGQILQQSGIEGVHYTVENGQRMAADAYIDGYLNVDDYQLHEGIRTITLFGIAASTSKVDNQPYELARTEAVVARTRYDRINEAYASLNWKTPLDWWLQNAQWKPVGLASGLALDPLSDEGTLEAKLTDFRVKNSAKLIQAASDEEFEALYQSLLEQYNAMNPKVVEDKFNEMYEQGKEEVKQYQ